MRNKEHRVGTNEEGGVLVFFDYFASPAKELVRLEKLGEHHDDNCGNGPETSATLFFVNNNEDEAVSSNTTAPPPPPPICLKCERPMRASAAAYCMKSFPCFFLVSNFF